MRNRFWEVGAHRPRSRTQLSLAIPDPPATPKHFAFVFPNPPGTANESLFVAKNPPATEKNLDRALAEALR
ncbi:MAG: hypothetical protein QOK24_2682 [Verrucomicrobiota bacterium]